MINNSSKFKFYSVFSGFNIDKDFKFINNGILLVLYMRIPVIYKKERLA